MGLPGGEQQPCFMALGFIIGLLRSRPTSELVRLFVTAESLLAVHCERVIAVASNTNC